MYIKYRIVKCLVEYGTDINKVTKKKVKLLFGVYKNGNGILVKAFIWT